MKRISGPASAGRTRLASQLLLSGCSLLLAAAAFSAGRHAAQQRAEARPAPAAATAAAASGTAAAASGGGAGAAAPTTPSGCPDDPWHHIDLEYDVAKARAVHDAPPPARRPGFQSAKSSPNKDLYDALWGDGLQTVGAGGKAAKESYQRSSCWGCRFVPGVVARLRFDTVLDAGTGNGMVVRAMRGRGKAAWGVELSRTVLERQAADLLAAGLVEQGSLTDLPFQDSSFDLVFSADVLEHLRPQDADAVVRELVRVSRRHIVMSISLKSFNNAKLHTLLRPRAWWEALFARHGAAPNRAVVWALQDKETRFSHAQRNLRNCTMDGDAADGGQYEVCVVDMTWLVGWPGQEVRRERCITPANAELEPWIFAFTVDKQGSESTSAAERQQQAAQQQQQQAEGRRGDGGEETAAPG